MPDEPHSDPSPLDLTMVTRKEIAEVLSYALRYDERGKLRRSGWDFAAERLTEHLRRSGYVVMRAHPGRPYSAG